MALRYDTAADGDGGGARGAAVSLGAYGFLILFFEFALARYVSGTVGTLSMHANLVALGALVGTGAGLLAARRVHRLRWTLLPITVFLLALVRWMSGVLVVGSGAGQDVTRTFSVDVPPDAVTIGTVSAVGMVYTVTTMFYVPIGAMLGAELRRFRPLVALSVTVLGGVAGVLCFALVSHAGNPPWMWFSLALAVLAVASYRHPQFELGVVGTIPIAIALIVATGGPNETWSPYHRVNWIERSDVHAAIAVNGTTRLSALDLSDRGASMDGFVRAAREHYRAPYEFVVRSDTALVVSAGAGNDVALLLEGGASLVDAVEIDPVMATFGSTRHFQRPYDDPRVHLQVSDARQFLRETTRRYDVIVFGTAHTDALVPGTSGLRVDGYTYTQEALRDAKHVLAPDGRVVLYLLSDGPEHAAKFYQMLTSVFGTPPIVRRTEGFSLFDHVFVAGVTAGTVADTTDIPSGLLTDPVVPTDDWPFRDLTRRTVPTQNLQGLGIALAVSLLLVLVAGGREGRHSVDAEMLLVGAGFMLTEARSVTELSLLFGSTWAVNFLVLGSSLLVILAASWLVTVRRLVGIRTLLTVLLVTLGIGYVLPVSLPAGGSHWVAWLGSGVIVSVPIVIAAILFATLLRHRSNAVYALAYALLGAAVGGVLAYAVTATGMRALALIAVGPYVVLWIISIGRQASSLPADA